MSRVASDFSDRIWKIVDAIYRLSSGGPRMVTYEDIVVRAWQLYPDDFGLRGYSDKYPDASDIHKPLYNVLKSRGWVTTGPPGQKKFALTQLGWQQAHAKFGGGARAASASGRASRTTEEEVRHLAGTMAAKCFLEGNREEILDTDFFDFYRTSVRAKPQEFEGRLASVKDALDEAASKNVAIADELRRVDSFLRDKFASIIKTKTERKKREG